VKRRQREFSLFIIVLFCTETAIIIARIEREISTWMKKRRHYTYPANSLHVSLLLKWTKKEYTALRKRHCALYSEFLNYVALCRECPNATKQTKHSAGKWNEEYRFNDITDCRSY
jgi:hypothetical protein